MSMFTDVFNCPGCKKPFDLKEGEPRRPGYSADFHCVACKSCGLGYKPLLGLMEFLTQPAFNKTDKGYDYTLPINDPVCFGCQDDIGLSEGASAFVGACGHYLCQPCDGNKSKVGRMCNTCNEQTDGSQWRLDGVLLRFFFAKVVRGQQLSQIEGKKEAARRSGALRNCSNCGIERPVERLIRCEDCQKILCGVCSFDSHQGHAAVKLFGIELDRLETQNDKRFTENVEGLHGNLKYIQTTIDEAVEKVLVAGKERLTKIKACAKYDEAENIASRVDKAGDKFEKHCEVYIPVARQFATRLTELGEELEKDEE